MRAGSVQMIRLVVLAGTLGIAVPITAIAAGAAAPARIFAAPVTPVDDFVVRSDSVRIGATTLRYTSRAGLIPIHDNDTGALVARMFVVAYTADPPAGTAPRPLTFIWNGGPGSSSSQVHWVGLGPKGFSTPATYPEWKEPPTQIGDRAETWLVASDLVFVDPVGTGYSRATSEHNRDELYSQHGDAEAVAEMIRVYRTRFDAFDQPLFLVGESYGTTRAAEVAGALARRGTPVSGVVLISGAYNLGQSVPHNLRVALEIPMFTVTAYYHKRLPADLQALPQAEAVRRSTEWARSTYAPALEHPSTLTEDQRLEIFAGLERFTAVSRVFVDQDTLVLTKDTVMDRLLEKQNLELGRYDSRMTTVHRHMPDPWVVTRDPSLAPMMEVMQGTSVPMIRYLRDTLGYHSDLLYRGPFGGSFHPRPFKMSPEGLSDDAMSSMWEWPADIGQDHETAPLREAMKLEPHLAVMSVQGMYDASCELRADEIARTDETLRARVRNFCYPAGHMVYTDTAPRAALMRDFSSFVAAAGAEASNDHPPRRRRSD
jgi:carboxypeptidase C (cathepsin A)